MYRRNSTQQCFITDSCLLEPWKDDQKPFVHRTFSVDLSRSSKTKRRSFSQFSSVQKQRPDLKQQLSNQNQTKGRIQLTPNKIMIPANPRQCFNKTDGFKAFKSFTDNQTSNFSTVGFKITRKQQYNKQKIYSSYSVLTQNKLNTDTKSHYFNGFRPSRKILTNNKRAFTFNFFVQVKKSKTPKKAEIQIQIQDLVKQKSIAFAKYRNISRIKFGRREKNSNRCETQC